MDAKLLQTMSCLFALYILLNWDRLEVFVKIRSHVKRLLKHFYYKLIIQFYVKSNIKISK